MSLSFNPRNHTYRLDGLPVPGVTTVLGVLDKPALPKWAAGVIAEYVADNPGGVEALRNMGRGPMIAALKGLPWQSRDEAANRGTEVHHYAERIVHGEEVDVPEAIAGHVESCIAFLDDYGIIPILTEQSVGSREHRYAGRFDLIADSRRGPRAIYDWKTARSGIYAQTAWQNAGYAFAEFYGEGTEHPMADLGIEASFGVHIRADGYDVHPLAFGPHIFDEFVTIRRAYDANKRGAGDWRQPGSGYVGISEQQRSNA